MRAASITLPTTPKKAATGGTSILETSHHSTPGRYTITKGTQDATVKDVEPQIKHDVDHSTNWGIDANLFLRIVLNLKNDDEYEPVRKNIENAVLNVKADEKYRDQLKDFTNAVDGDKRFAGTEKKMYEPFVKMGNMLLEELEKGDNAKKIRLCYNNEKTVKQKEPRRGPVIKPDVLLVPETVEQGRKNMENIHIQQVLSPFEFKLKKNSARKEVAEEESCADETSVKASVDEVSARMASMISSAVASTDTASTGMKRKKRDIATNGSHKSMKGREGDTANSASRAYSRRDDTDPHGQRQLARYAAAAMSERGDRKFVYGVRVNAREMTFLFYHRSGLIEANPFDFCEHPEIFALFLYMFQRDPPTYGFNKITGYCDPFNMDDEASETLKMGIKDKLEDKNAEYVKNGVYDDLVIEDQEAAEYGIVGRGGSVFKVVAPNHKEVPAMAVKFSWQSTSRKHEIENMEIARRCIPDHVAQTYGHATVKDDTPFAELKAACSHSKKDQTEKTFRVLAMKHYHRLSEVDNLEMFWDLICQLVVCEYQFFPDDATQF